MKKLFAVLAAVSLIAFCGCAQENAAQPLGVWWWNSNLSAEYLDFAAERGVTEIYYCDSAFDSDTASFIKSANGRKIKVYWLAGEYQWIEDATSLYSDLARFAAFQSANQGSRFEGVHLDIEPHQSPDFSEKRAELLEKFVALAYRLSADFKDIKFDYDIPFWLDDEIEYGGKTQPAYAHIIECADRTFIMSYRDTAEKIYDTAKDEVEFAKSAQKTLFLGVETYSTEGDFVSFMEEGKAYMYGEMEKLRAMLPENFGISVHQIKTWYDLKD